MCKRFLFIEPAPDDSPEVHALFAVRIMVALHVPQARVRYVSMYPEVGTHDCLIHAFGAVLAGSGGSVSSIDRGILLGDPAAEVRSLLNA